QRTPMSRRVCWLAALVVVASASAATLQVDPSSTGTAVIAGRIVDRMQRPLKNVLVALLAKDIPSGQFSVVGRQILTDASGAFRFGSLASGRYYICGTHPRPESNALPDYPPTCSPG